MCGSSKIKRHGGCVRKKMGQLFINQSFCFCRFSLLCLTVTVDNSQSRYLIVRAQKESQHFSGHFFYFKQNLITRKKKKINELVRHSVKCLVAFSLVGCNVKKNKTKQKQWSIDAVLAVSLVHFANQASARFTENVRHAPGRVRNSRVERQLSIAL